MAAPLPAALRTPDIQRFAKRAAQLEKFRPIVTYWCEYHILQQILSKQLHASDDETSQYAVQLMDKLETVKAENSANDAIIDDVAAKAYIENFATETFNRADEAQRNNKVTVQTADTFQASSTFMDLLSIWSELDQEMLAKSKFAKFHAMRILKAVKAGEDPNASNPVIEEPPAPADDRLEAELKELEQSENTEMHHAYQPPTVENAPDNATTAGLGSQATLGDVTLPTPSPVPDAPPGLPIEDAASQPSAPDLTRQTSVGGGYFPTVPSAPSAADMAMPDAMSATGVSQPVAQPPELPAPSQEQANPHDFYNSASTPPVAPIISPDRQPSLTASQMNGQSALNAPPTRSAVPVPAPAPAPPMPTQVAPIHQAPPSGGYRTDDDSTMAAQKHARWAISALNFEDVNTAVKELHLALQSLGAA